jgi:hypothetical protein
VVGLGVIALAAAPSAAAAPASNSSHREVQQPSASAIAYFRGVDGYEVVILNPSSHVAILYVVQSSEGGVEGISSYAQTAYAVRPERSIGSGVLRARFGSIGTVNLRFRPSGETRVGHTGKHCRGRRPQSESGHYRGTVSLRGEDGYFQLHAKRASGTRSRTFRLNCASGQAHKDKSKPLYEYVAPDLGFFADSAGGSIALILAVSRRGGRFVYLRAAHMQSSGPGAEVQAGALEREPGMAIGHSAFATGGEGTLLTSLPGVHPATATLAPPAPFHGEANFVENSSSSHSWTGTLGVNFPGLDLPLTGPSYATSLCVSSPFKTPLPCDFRNLPLVPE